MTQKVRILVCDPDVNVRNLVATRLLTRGYEVIEKSEQSEILLYLEQENVALILLATELDRVGGSYLIEKIRAQPHLTTVPIILMTHRDQIADLITCQDRGFDDFLIKPFDAFILQMRVSINIRRVRDRVDANALTHLPGNHAIERVIQGRIDRQEKFSVLYIDINNFKTFNDRYGFEKGDDVIRQTAKILLKHARESAACGDCFVGHVGGDDFVVVLNPEDEEVYARAFLEEFDRISVTYYNDEDRERGSVRVTNRRGKRETFPLMSCSVAACNNLYRPYKNLGEIAQDAAQVKSFLKSQSGSHYLRDRRSEPLREVKQAVQILAPTLEKKKNGRLDGPLGETLLREGVITEEQLSQALKIHFETGKRLGQVLIQLGFVKSEIVGRILEKQWRIAYKRLERLVPSREALGLLPESFMQSRRVLPLEITGESLKLAMSDPNDQEMLSEIKNTTGLEPKPYVALENELEQFWHNRPPEWSQEEIA